MQLVSFRIDEATLQGLDFLARRGQTRSALICQAVREYVGRHLLDNSVIEMNAKAFDEFMDSLNAEPTQEELEGRRRLQNIRYPWSTQQ